MSSPHALTDFVRYLGSLPTDPATGRPRYPHGSAQAEMNHFAQSTPAHAALLANTMRDHVIPTVRGLPTHWNPRDGWAPIANPADLPKGVQDFAESLMIEDTILSLDERMNIQADNNALAQARIDNPNMHDDIEQAFNQIVGDSNG